MEDWRKLFSIDRSGFCVSCSREIWKMCIMTCIFNNTTSANWVAYVTRNFLRCYSCLYYSSMVQRPKRSSIWRSNFRFAVFVDKKLLQNLYIDLWNEKVCFNWLLQWRKSASPILWDTQKNLCNEVGSVNEVT